MEDNAYIQANQCLLKGCVPWRETIAPMEGIEHTYCNTFQTTWQPQLHKLLRSATLSLLESFTTCEKKTLLSQSKVRETCAHLISVLDIS
jgi:hypothetical protein